MIKSYLKTAIRFFGKNKISFRNYLGGQLVNTYTKRSHLYKPDEDTLAHAGTRNLTNQQFFINSQLAGEHILGDNGKLKLDWQITYTYHEQQNPDEVQTPSTIRRRLAG